MGRDQTPEPGAYIGQLAGHARRLQAEARVALECGEYSRASRLIADAELLAEDVHDLVSSLERRESGALLRLGICDLRETAVPTVPAVPRPVRRISLTPHAIRLALGASLTIGFALAEY